LAQICTKSFVGWGFAPDPTGGAYSAPPDPLAGLGGGAPGERERGGKGKRREGRGGRGGEGSGGLTVVFGGGLQLSSAGTVNKLKSTRLHVKMIAYSHIKYR